MSRRQDLGEDVSRSSFGAPGRRRDDRSPPLRVLLGGCPPGTAPEASGASRFARALAWPTIAERETREREGPSCPERCHASEPSLGRLLDRFAAATGWRWVSLGLDWPCGVQEATSK
jgi:hypothetical protein